jgi:hypothetical protein
MKVEITATCKVGYAQIVDMSEEGFAAYEDACASGKNDQWFNNFAGEYINPSDILEAWAFEDVYVKKLE